MKKKNVYLIIIFLIISSFIAFSPVAKNEFINFDDDVYITENTHIQSGFNLENIQWAFSTFHRSYWHPLTWMSHMLDWQLFGNDAGGHHLVSLLLHIGTAILLFLFLHKTTGNLWPAAFAAAFFALHPLRVESVAWASERKDVLSMFFGMASVYAYAFYAERTSISRYGLCLLLFIFSLMSKPMWVTLPFALLLLDYWPLGRIRKAFCVPGENKLKSVGMLVWEKVPFLILAIAASIIVFLAENTSGALSSVDTLPLTARMTNAVFSYAMYLAKTFWPANLIVFYPYDFFLPPWKIILSLSVLIIISLMVVYYIKSLPFLFSGWFWYLGTLVPMIGLVQVGKHAMADRYTYLPSMGIAMMLAWGIPLFFREKEIRKRLLLPSAIVVLAMLSLLTWHQCGYWKSGFSLFNHAARVMQIDRQTLKHMGGDFTQLGRYQQQKEIQSYSEAIRLKPNDAEAYFNRGNAYSKIDRNENAIQDLTDAIRLKPDYVEAFNNRGNIYGRHGQYQLAIDDFNKVIAIQPDYVKTYNNRGLAYSALGQHQKAVEDFSRAIQLKPDYVSAYLNRADAYLKQNHTVAGCRDAEKACGLGDCSLTQALKAQGTCR